MDFEAPISEVMKAEVETTDLTTSVFDACKIMSEKKVNTLVVIDQGKPVGLLSDQDIVNKVVVLQKNPVEVLVKDVISKDLVVEKEENTILDASLTMNQHDLKRIPIINEQGNLVGILSLTDIIHILAEFTLFENLSRE